MSARIAAPTMSREALSAVQVDALFAALRRRAAGGDLALPELPADVEPLVGLLVEVSDAVTGRAMLNGTVQPATEAALSVRAKAEQRRPLPKPPRLLTVADIAARLGWSTRRARRMLIRLGVIDATPGSKKRHLIPVALLLQLKPRLSIFEEDDI